MEFVINSKTHGAKKVLVDAEDWSKIKGYTWSIHLRRGKFYVSAYLRKKGVRRQEYIQLHNLVMTPSAGKVVDHINGCPLDNRKKNLRVCTQAENSRNRVKGKNNTSGFKGVSWHKGRSRWEATIRVDGKQLYLGLFDTAEAAAIAYNQAAIKTYGEYALLNK